MIPVVSVTMLYSTNKQSLQADFKEATIKGRALIKDIFSEIC